MRGNQTIIPIVFPSAAFFWLNYNQVTRQDSCSINNRKLVSLPESYPFQLSNADAPMIASAIECPLPLFVLSPSPESRVHNQNIHSFIRPSHLPEKAFIDIHRKVSLSSSQTADILMASPELCFLEAASFLNFYQLVVFGCDLCSIYVADNDTIFKQQSREQITTVEKIRDFLENTYYVRGRRKALRAVSYLANRTNSKIETFMAVLANVSSAWGGYALKPPSMNTGINFSPEAKELLGNRNCYYDMVWEPEKVIAEYDSDLTHLSSEQHMIDKHKATAAVLSGYQIIHITKADISSLPHLDRTFTGIRKMLGMRPIDEELSKYIARRKELIHAFWTFDINNLILSMK